MITKGERGAVGFRRGDGVGDMAEIVSVALGMVPSNFKRKANQ